MESNIYKSKFWHVAVNKPLSYTTPPRGGREIRRFGISLGDQRGVAPALELA
jgi:hypothetical protein